MKQHCPKASFFPKGKGRWHGVSRDGGIGNSSVRHSQSASSHRARLQRPGVAWLRTALRSVCSPLQPFGPPTASGRGGNAFLRFAPTLNSAWSFHCARKLACGSPCFIGLTTACFRHWRRPSCAPALRLRGVPCLRTSCARHFSPSGLHLFASICSRKMPEMTYTPSFLI